MEKTYEWLNEEFLTSILKASNEDNINAEDLTVVDHKVKRALEDGKNFSSIIYKLSVSYKYKDQEVQNKRYIVKKLVEAVSMLANNMGEKEAEALNALSKIQKYVNSTFGPKLYTYTDTILVMEDLTEAGFQNCQAKLMDYDHCVLALKALAKFHAGALLLHQSNPKLVEEKLGGEIFLNDSAMDIIRLLQNSILQFSQEISNWPESRQYAKELLLTEKKIREYFENIPKRNSLKTLNHGDFWMNNMMFKYDSGAVCECRVVDFQICRFAPLTCDFQYFMGSSTDFDVRSNRLDELINVYLDTFNCAVAGLGLSEKLTREQFEEDLKADGVMYLVGMTGPLKAILADPEDACNLDGLEENNFEEEVNKISMKMLKSRELRKFLPPVLEDLDKRGVFRSFRD